MTTLKVPPIPEQPSEGLNQVAVIVSDYLSQGFALAELRRRLETAIPGKFHDLVGAFGLLAELLEERTADLSRAEGELDNEVALRLDAGQPRITTRDDVENTAQTRAAKLRTSNDAIVQNENRFRSIVELAADAIIIANASGHITLVNGSACQMFGYGADEMVGRLVEDLLPSELRTSHLKHREAFYADPKPRSMGEGFQIKGLRKDGSEFIAEASLTPFQTPEGLTVAATVRDVTEKRRLEHLAEEALAELQRSNAELEQFAYVASHDLQEPLRMVGSYTQLLARRYAGLLDDDAKTFIGFAVEGAERMQSLINDLLEISRLGNSGNILAPVSMESVMERTRLNLRASIVESGVLIDQGPLPIVNGDEVQLTQLMQNLITNAIKFRGHEPPHIKIAAKELRGFWTFSVEDNGIGIDPAYKERIFVIFQRLHTRADYPGTGIGLALCKRIVERHGGKIRVESTLGAGSTFSFTLKPAVARGTGRVSTSNGKAPRS